MINDQGGLFHGIEPRLPANHHGACMLDLGLLDRLENCQQLLSKPPSMVCDLCCNYPGVSVLGITKRILRFFELGPNTSEPRIKNICFEFFIPLTPVPHCAVADILGLTCGFEGCAEAHTIDNCLDAFGSSKGWSSHCNHLEMRAAAANGWANFSTAAFLDPTEAWETPRPRCSSLTTRMTLKSSDSV